MSQSRTQESYELESLKPGLVTIINIEEFNQNHRGHSKRNGSTTDVKGLDTIFRSLQMHVDLFENLTENEMMSILELEDRGYRHYGMSVFIVMSHGNKDEVYATDGSIKVDDIVAAIERKKELKNKPKIFIFQACRGYNANIPEEDFADYDSLIEIDATSLTKPNFADCFIIYSTIPGHVSYRHRTEGSWFIQEFCKVVTEFSRQEDICGMMSKVTEELSIRETNGARQLCTYTSTLTKKLYLTKEAYEKNVNRIETTEVSESEVEVVEGESTILLLGSPGVGKGTLGNTILGEKVFTTSSMMQSGTLEMKNVTRNIDGRHAVTVIDTPGIDFKKGREETFARQFKDLLKEMKSGINAFVFVLPYGKRLNKNELCVLLMFREMFGAEYFYKYGLPVFTRGDDFETDDNAEGKTWQQWLMSLPDDSMEKKIMSYFENEPILINNRTRDEKFKRKQSRSLINLAARVSHQGTYGIKQFEEVNPEFDLWKMFVDFLKWLWRKIVALFNKLSSCVKTNTGNISHFTLT